MEKRSKRWLSALALATGATGAALWLWRKNDLKKENSAGMTTRDRSADRWARPGMLVTFRAELMPGRDAAERTFRVVEFLPSERVLLENFAGEHGRQEFEPVR